ncbi:hypothetical protein GQ457_05G018270 [Hibiscus cannabinus]
MSQHIFRFNTIPNQDYWSVELISEEWLPNPKLCRKLKGQTSSTHTHTNMDDPDDREREYKLTILHFSRDHVT